MTLLYIFLIALGIIILFILIIILPRKKNYRRPNLEGLDNPEIAKAFEKMTDFLPFKLLRRKVLNQINKKEPQGHLIDVGCGSGNLLVEIAEKFPYLFLTGTDISSEILKLAKERAFKHELGERIDFKEGSVEKLPFPDNSINFIVSSLSLHHWLHPIKAFQEFQRILNEDGTILIFDFRRDARKIFYYLFKFATKVVVPKALKEVNEPLGSIQSSYTPAEIKQIIFQNLSVNIKINSFLAWMFIIINK